MYLDPLWVFIGFFFLLAVVFFVFAGRAFRRKHYFGSFSRSLAALVFLLSSVLAGLLSFATWGYKALTFEEILAHVEITVLEPQRFLADFRFSDGSSQSFALSGDQLYVDAKVLKWHPYANLLGFKTLYEFDRVAGRYRSLDDELKQPRSLYSLETKRNLDLFKLSRNYPFFSFLLDAEYGSATFSDIKTNTRYQISLSNSGLLIREQ